jgi:hypothetical protein
MTRANPTSSQGVASLWGAGESFTAKAAATSSRGAALQWAGTNWCHSAGYIREVRTCSFHALLAVTCNKQRRAVLQDERYPNYRKNDNWQFSYSRAIPEKLTIGSFSTVAQFQRNWYIPDSLRLHPSEPYPYIWAVQKASNSMTQCVIRHHKAIKPLDRSAIVMISLPRCDTRPKYKAHLVLKVDRFHQVGSSNTNGR